MIRAAVCSSPLPKTQSHPSVSSIISLLVKFLKRMHIVLALCVAQNEQLKKALQKAEGPLLVGGASQTTTRTGAHVIAVRIGTVPPHDGLFCTSSIGRALHRMSGVLCKQQSIAMQWELAEEQSSSRCALVLVGTAASAFEKLQKLLVEQIGLEPSTGGPQGSISLGMSRPPHHGGVPLRDTLAATVECFTSTPVTCRTVGVYAVDNDDAPLRLLGAVEVGKPPATGLYCPPKPCWGSDGEEEGVVPRREVVCIPKPLEKDTPLPQEALQMALVRATAWIKARRAMASLPQTRDAWRHTLKTFGVVQVRFDVTQIIDRMISNNFLEQTTMNAPDPAKKVCIVFNGPTSKMFKNYRRVPDDFDTKTLEKGQTMRRFPAITSVPAYSIKMPSGKGGSDAFDPPVDPPQLGDTTAFQLRIRRCIKHMVIQMKPAPGTDRVIIPAQRFRRLLNDVAIVRVVVSADDMIDGLLSSGALQATQTSGRDPTDILIPTPIA